MRSVLSENVAGVPVNAGLSARWALRQNCAKKKPFSVFNCSQLIDNQYPEIGVLSCSRYREKAF